MGTKKLDKRIESVRNRREELRRKSREALEQAHSSKLRGKQEKGVMKGVVESLNLQTLFEDPELKDKLTQAGFRGNGPATTFYFFRLASPIILLAGASFYLFYVNDFGLPTITRACAALGLGMLGYYAPNLYLKNAATKRQQSIMMAFPDALDLMLICVEAGMSIEAAFQKVSTEIGSQSIELAEELSLTTAELSYLQDRRVAYENLAKRTNHPGVKAVAGVACDGEGKPGYAAGQCREEGGGPACKTDGPDDCVFSAGTVRCHSRTGHHALPEYVIRAMSDCRQ